MLEKLEEQIKLSDEVLSSMPINNIKNQELFLQKLEAERNSYQKTLDSIVQELKRRNSGYEALQVEPQQDASAAINQLKKALTYTNNLSTPYEKLRLDKIIYELCHYQDHDLTQNTGNILKAIYLFQIGNVPLTSSDFNYTKFVHEYMEYFFLERISHEKIQEAFDQIYWECPNLITQVELNLRYLYEKNADKLKNYINGFNKKMLSGFQNGEQSILDDYNYLRKKYDLMPPKNQIIKDFYDGKRNIDDYTDDKIAKLTSNLFKDSYDESKIEVVKQLLNSLKEYRNYLTYKDLIDEAKKLFQEPLEDGYLNKSKKKIKDLENKLFKLNKKSTNRTKKTKVDKIDPEIDGLIKEIKQAYTEIDNHIFQIIVKEHLENNSTVFKLLLLLCQYYVVLADYFKSKNENISAQEIEEEINKLHRFTMDSNNTIINNITILEEREVSGIIITNYRLLNLNVEESMIQEGNLDNFIQDLEKILYHHHMKLLGISIEELQNAKKIKEVLEKNKTI